MNKESSSDLEKSIDYLSYQINSLKRTADLSDTTSKLYNKLLIERAVLKKKLEQTSSNNLANLFKKLRFNNKKHLISDYFS